MHMIATSILLLVLAVVTSVVAVDFEPISGHSERWDQMLHEIHRQKRQAGCNWQTLKQDCTPLGDVRQFDKKERRTHGLLSEIESQGECGSCWAFAAVHAVRDSRNLRAMTRQTNLLSTEYTTRCAAPSALNGYGCCGGCVQDALEHFKTKGSPTDRCLPYNKNSSLLPWYIIWFAESSYKGYVPLSCPTKCDDGSPLTFFQLYDYRCYKPNNEHLIIQAIERGHVVITSMVLDKMLHAYGCGIFCENERTKVNHAVVIVDYGTTENGVKFWVIKNSWGRNWGEKGYFRVRRGNGDLGIGTDFPICVPLLFPDPLLPPSTADSTNAVTACSPTNVQNPKSDPVTMSALEFGLEAAIDGHLVQCPGGANATNFTVVKIMDATVQSVAGSVVELGVLVEVGGCEKPFCENVEMTVFSGFDGNITLLSFISSSRVLTPFKLILFVMVLVPLLVGLQ